MTYVRRTPERFEMFRFTGEASNTLAFVLWVARMVGSPGRLRGGLSIYGNSVRGYRARMISFVRWEVNVSPGILVVYNLDEEEFHVETESSFADQFVELTTG